MQWTCEKDDETVRLTTRGIWAPSAIVTLLLWVGFFMFLSYVVEDPIVRIVGSISLLCPLLLMIGTRLKRDVLTIYTDKIELYRNRFGIGCTKTFLRSNVQGFGFVPGRAREGNTLSVRDSVHFLLGSMARGIRTDEASEVLAKIESFGTWLTPMICPVGTPLVP